MEMLQYWWGYIKKERYYILGLERSFLSDLILHIAITLLPEILLCSSAEGKLETKILPDSIIGT